MADGQGNWKFKSEVRAGRIEDTREVLPGFEVADETLAKEKVKKRRRSVAELKADEEKCLEFQALKLKLKQEGKLL